MIRVAVVACAVMFFVSMISATGTANAGDQADFMASHYPPEALKKGEEGRVGFRVSISKDGVIEQC